MHLIVAIFLVLLACALPARADELQAQDAALKQMVIRNAAGERLDLTSHPGKILFVDFWAHWCPSCLNEMASLKTLQKDLGPDRIQVVLVSGQRDWPQDQAYAAAHGIQLPLYVAEPAPAPVLATALMGRNLGSNEVQNTLPMAAIFTPDGRLMASALGGHDWSSPALEKDMLAAAGTK